MWWIGQSATKKSPDGELRARTLSLHDRLAAEALAVTAGDRLGILDDFSLRFDVMILLTAGVLHRLQREMSDTTMAQALWEMTYEGFQESLRNRGVTDMGMGRRMKKLLLQGTGRRDAYLAAWDAGDVGALRRAVARNVLNGADPEDERVDRLLEAVTRGMEGIGL